MHVNCMNFTSKADLENFKLNIEDMIKLISYKNFSTNSDVDSSRSLFIGVTKAVFYIILIIIALFGNLLIIAVIFFNKFLRKPTNYYIFNLAICDLAIVFTSMWVQIVLGLNENWVLGEYFCKLNSYMQMVSIIASVLTLSAIAYDRYHGIVHPLESRYSSTNQCYIIITLIWIFSCVISIPTYIYRTYREQKWFDYDEKSCDDFGWPYELAFDSKGCVIKVQLEKRVYYTTVILLLFFLPILIMSISYSIVINKLWTLNVIGEGGQVKSSVLKQRRKVIIMLVWVLGVFFVCWAPIETLLILMVNNQNEFPRAFSNLEWIAYFMAYCNAAINPLIYGGLNENFQSGIKRLRSSIRLSQKSKKDTTSWSQKSCRKLKKKENFELENLNH